MTKRYKTPLTAFINRHERAEDGCWNWTGATTKGGYAVIKYGRVAHYAHRFIYEQTNGPIPLGYQVDHLCFNRSCVNPDHLEPVTPAENTRRARERKRAMETVQG